MAASLQIHKYQIPRHGSIPNTSLHDIPFIHYKSAFPASVSARDVEKKLKSHSWTPAWHYTMYRTSHFHSTTHECLCIISGSARILLGGDNDPESKIVDVTQGDVMFMPVGVSHKLLEDTSDGEFLMVGAYPAGAGKWDMCYGKEGEDVEGIEMRVRRVGEQDVQDPVFGGKIGDST